MRKLLILTGLLLSFLAGPAPQAAGNAALAVPDLDLMLDQHGAVMLLIAADTGEILFANQAAARFYGFSREELLEMNIDAINTLSNAETSREMRDAAREERNYFRFRHRLADGSVRDVDVFSYPYQLEGQTVLFSVIHDVTGLVALENRSRLLTRLLLGGLSLVAAGLVAAGWHLKNLNRRLRTENRLRETFINSQQEMVGLKDRKLRYVFANRPLASLMGLTPEEMEGKTDLELLGKEELFGGWAETDREVLETGRTLSFTSAWGDRAYQCDKFPVELEDGTTGVGSDVRDITYEVRHRKLEESILKRHRILVDVLTRNFSSTADQMDYVLKEALELTGSTFGYIYLYHEKTRQFSLVSWSTDVMDQCRMMEKYVHTDLGRAGMWGEVVRQRRTIVDNEFQAPGAMKKGLPPGHVPLLRFMSVPVMNQGEIEAVIGLANKEEPYDDHDVQQITALMSGVWHARQSRETDLALRDSREQLQLILDSAAEGIFGMDPDGSFTFVNASALRMLGYGPEEDLSGRNVHRLVHHTRPDGKDYPEQECRILRSLQLGEVVDTDGEVFWRADGTSFPVNILSTPQWKDGQIVGAVVTFVDITRRKLDEERILYLSYHDTLTGLYNRRYFEEELNRLDRSRNLPVSVIMGDLNGLKAMNDIFGHSAGDILLKRAAEAIRDSCRGDDILARLGGDEFAILLPGTHLADAEKIAGRIHERFSGILVEGLPGSMALGAAAKEDPEDTLQEVLERAEEEMYRRKTLEKKEFSAGLVERILGNLHRSYPAEEEHSRTIRHLASLLGQALNMTDKEKLRLEEAAWYHDVGKVILAPEIMQAEGDLSPEEMHRMRQHPTIGYRIMKFSDDTMDLADLVLSHHERWDGTGYPRGVSGQEIALPARMLALAEYYSEITRDRPQGPALSPGEAREQISREAGKRLDPHLVEVFLGIPSENLPDGRIPLTDV